MIEYKTGYIPAEDTAARVNIVSCMGFPAPGIALEVDKARPA